MGRGGLRHLYAIVVPEDYDPQKPYPVIFYLHGGVSRPAPQRSDTWWPEALVSPSEDGAEAQIIVIPAGWSESLWWQAYQVENLVNILDRLKRSYNVDENRVALMGVSDGGTGAYFHAFRATTPWASFLSFIGHSRVLGSASVKADGDIFPVNLSNKPWFIVNTANDRLYPSNVVVPYLELFKRVGTEIEFRHQPDSGHDLRWWPQEADRIDQFIEDRVRDPLPDSIVWETERVDRYNRAHWLIIDELGSAPGQSDLPEFNSITMKPRDSSLDVSREADGSSQSLQAFPRSGGSGRVEVSRTGNNITVRTEGVRKFHLLLSPDQFDFNRPIRVETNGVVSYQGTIGPDVETLFKWAATDNDRTMLFGAELEVEMGKGSLTDL